MQFWTLGQPSSESVVPAISESSLFSILPVLSYKQTEKVWNKEELNRSPLTRHQGPPRISAVPLYFTCSTSCTSTQCTSFCERWDGARTHGEGQTLIWTTQRRVFGPAFPIKAMSCRGHQYRISSHRARWQVGGSDWDTGSRTAQAHAPSPALSLAHWHIERRFNTWRSQYSTPGCPSSLC